MHFLHIYSILLERGLLVEEFLLTQPEKEAETSNKQLRIPEGSCGRNYKMLVVDLGCHEVILLSALNRELHWEHFGICIFSALFPRQQT